MKIIPYIIVFLLVLSCKDQPNPTTASSSTEEMATEPTANDLNQKVPDEEDGGEMLLGKINFDGLQQEPFNEWFSLNREGHVLDSTVIDSLKPLLTNISIKVFMGTWCEDSQREIPALKKILDAAHYKSDYLDMVAVTHDKDTPQGFEKDYELEYVPTIIFFKDGAEINRIVEYPQETLERDMLTILSGKPYKHPYVE